MPNPEHYYLAQVNIALPREPLSTPLLAPFVAALEPINAVADASPGFVWRLQTEDGDATAIRAFGDDRLIVNMSVWETIDDLAAFVYRSTHTDIMRRRREWFERMETAHCLWWVPAGHFPSISEAEDRLAHLLAHGPSPVSFTFITRFDPPGSTRAIREQSVDESWACPA